MPNPGEALRISQEQHPNLTQSRMGDTNIKKIFISTGATFDEEIEKAASILKGTDFSFLHCITIYPTPLEKIYLSRMDYLKQFSPNVGFSDHALVSRDGIKASAAALYFGAEVIERHFTILGADNTKDGPVSITPNLLKELVSLSCITKEELYEYIKEKVPEYTTMLGSRQRELSSEELLNRDYYRGRFATKTTEGQTIYNWEE